MTITIDDTLFADILHLARERGEDPNRFAVAVLRKAVNEHRLVTSTAKADTTEDEDSDLTDADRLAIRDGIQRGLESVAAGRLRSFSEFAAEQRAKYDLP
jgi:predicted transcriptional regulator